MLKHRLIVGTLLALGGVALLAFDPAPYYPVLLAFGLIVLAALAYELHQLLPADVRPNLPLLLKGIALLVFANWAPAFGLPGSALAWLTAALVVNLMAAFLYEASTYREPGRVTRRLALTFFIWGYVALLGSFLIQLRWYLPTVEGASTTALLLAIFVPKCCDIGAYFTGRLLGKHRMTPVLSPKKTWEGAAGGLTFAALISLFITHVIARSFLLDPVVGITHAIIDEGVPDPTFPLTRELLLGLPGWVWSLLFGLIVGLAGMLGDLMESLLKRDLGHKDAAATLPGFGGLLDVFDALLFSAPITYGILHGLAYNAGVRG
jgi:phosphatidate cytidylyltransferase